MLVAYGVPADGTRQLLAFLCSQGESQTAWEGVLEDLYRRGLRGEKLLLIVTDGCPGLAAAIETVYPRALHQRCWVNLSLTVSAGLLRLELHDPVFPEP